ncbi:MAG: hypothetical protein JWL59_4531 [Chthoniobacteraceae bacterium]|nr:hypothetical protein [Chthoniobacteraceae bacterium]
MYRTSFLRFFVAACTFEAAASAIDLTPRYVTTASDGVRSRHPCFLDGNKKYAVTLDSETELLPGEGAAIFNFTKFRRAVMKLTQSPLKPSLGSDLVDLALYRKTAERLLPDGAIHPVIVSEDSEVLPINRWRSKQLVFDYEFAGAQMRESVIFLELNPTSQIIVQIRAGEADFTTVSSRGLSIIRRWHEVTPDLEHGGN